MKKDDDRTRLNVVTATNTKTNAVGVMLEFKHHNQEVSLVLETPETVMELASSLLEAAYKIWPGFMKQFDDPKDPFFGFTGDAVAH